MANLRARQSGMSLVEIMVAVVLGLIGILIITQAYISSDNFNRSTLGEGGAQTNGLVALYTIERDARMAGYGMTSNGALACGQIYWYYDPNYSANTPGWSGNPAALPAITLAPIVITTTAGAPDTIQVMYSSTAEMMVPTSIAGFNASSSEVDVDGTTGFNAGDLVLMVGGSGCTLGKITQVQPGPSKLQLNPYLNFNGNCRAALEYYEKVLGGKIEAMMTFGESPVCDSMPKELSHHIMHGCLNLGQFMLMGSDCMPGQFEPNKGISNSLNVEEVSEAERIFTALAKQGTIIMPLAETFWAKRFGMLIDQFGIQWMVNCQ